MKRTQYFSRIAIIQSLPEGELSTGRKLFEELDTLNTNQDIGIEIKFNNVCTSKDFIYIIFGLIAEAKKTDMIPILHIEAHGISDKNGIVLASGEVITWKELKDPLIQLNEATKNNLFVVLASCWGGYLMEILTPVDKSPCWGLIGPSDKMTAAMLLKNYTDFYVTLLSTGDGDAALAVLNANSCELHGYLFQTAETMFKSVFSGYITKFCSDEMIEERALEVQREALEKYGNVPQRLNEIKSALANTRESFEIYKKRFLMLDMFPENAARFKIKYEDCL